MATRELQERMVVFVNGKPVTLSAEDTAIRQKLLREAVAVTVARYRPALERLEDA